MQYSPARNGEPLPTSNPYSAMKLIERVGDPGPVALFQPDLPHRALVRMQKGGRYPVCHLELLGRTVGYKYITMVH